MAQDEIEGARAAVGEAAELLAWEIATAPGERAGELKGRAEALNTVASAVSLVTWGPQGGHRRDESRHESATSSQVKYDYGAVDRRPAGFGHQEG